MIKRFFDWLDNIFCDHTWVSIIYSKDAYDEEKWEECFHCNKKRKM